MLVHGPHRIHDATTMNLRKHAVEVANMVELMRTGCRSFKNGRIMNKLGKRGTDLQFTTATAREAAVPNDVCMLDQLH